MLVPAVPIVETVSPVTAVLSFETIGAVGGFICTVAVVVL